MKLSMQTLGSALMRILKRKGRKFIRSKLARRTERQNNANLRKYAQRVAIAWLITFIGLEVAFGIALQGPLDSIRNPEHAVSSSLLRELHKKNADKPLVLILGSSRAQQAIRPDLINDNLDQPFVYNFARAGHGPRHHYVTLKRLMREGVRPDSVVLELAPHQLIKPTAPADSKLLLNHSFLDLMESLPFREQPDQSRDEWLRAQLMMPCFSYRYHVMAQLLPAWNPTTKSVGFFNKPDPYGWVPWKRGQYEYVATPEIIRHEHRPLLKEWQIEPLNRKAIEEILNVCRGEHIPVAIVFMPEGPVFRSCYSAESENNLREFQSWLARFPGVKVVNAREWMNDEDCYVDSQHMECDSAPLFTKMFAERVLTLLPVSNADQARRRSR